MLGSIGVEENRKIEWRSFPMKEKPFLSVVVFLICALFLILVYQCWTQPSNAVVKSTAENEPLALSDADASKRNEPKIEESMMKKTAPFVIAFFALILFLSLRRFFLPTTYSLDDESVTMTTGGWQKKRKWSEFRNAYFYKVGIRLSPFEKPHFLDGFRSIFLRYGENGQGGSKEIERFVKEKISQEKRGRGGGAE